MSTENDPVSFADALNQVAKNLRKQPVLLFTLGALILVLAAGTLALPNLRVVIVAILVLVLAGLLVWVYMEMEKMRDKRERNTPRPAEPAPQRTISSGGIEGEDQNVIDEAITTGNVKATVAGTESISSGPVKFGSGNKFNAPVKSGDVTVNQPEPAAQEDEEDDE